MIVRNRYISLPPTLEYIHVALKQNLPSVGLFIYFRVGGSDLSSQVRFTSPTLEYIMFALKHNLPSVGLFIYFRVGGSDLSSQVRFTSLPWST